MTPPSFPTRTRAHESVAAGLDVARLAHWEEPGRALSLATRAEERARVLGSEGLQGRAIAVQAAVSMHRGDLRGAFALAAEAERFATDEAVRAEICSLYAQLHYFSGSYAESLRQAEQAIELADLTGDLGLRLHARRMGCVAFGNIGVEDLDIRLSETLDLAIEADSPWEEAIVRNDLACFAMASRDLIEARAHLDRALEMAGHVGPHNRFLLAVIHCTRSELRLDAGEIPEAVRDATRAVGYLVSTDDDVNPYLLGMSVLVLVRGLLAAGRVEDARKAVEASLDRLGDRVPQTRSQILASVAEALRAAGRAEEAYDALAKSAALAHKALEEFSRLQVGLERERLQTASARRQADALAARNRRLELVVDTLRDEADRDALTGLHNRRYLARAGLATSPDEPISFAIADVDRFKSINDSFGHVAGDQVLIRIAELLVTHLREHDVVMRIGGEEFALLMPGAEAEEALLACERLRSVIADEPWDAIAPGLRVTASFGLASGAGDVPSLQLAADAQLYAAKRGGRNRVAA
jgi:diguanylate cyclase (GGDEF)-like protein